MQYQPKEFEIVEVEVDGEIIQARRYADGSLRNERGQPIPGTKIPNDGYEITHETARDMHARRQMRTRQAIEDGAARFFEGKMKRKPRNTDEIIELIGEGLIARAADPKNAKGVDAARLYLQETGRSIATGQDEQATQDDVMRQAIREAAKGARVELRIHEAKLTIRREE